jgi:asparagine synthase (glutamine-hydrolysing)
MFRYIARAWDDTVPAHASAAGRLGMELRSLAHWTPAFLRPGLQVCVRDARPGINGPYVLAADHGVVLGKLFRRRDLHRPSATDLTLTDDEADRIVRDNGRTLVNDFWGRYVAFMRGPTGTTRVLRDPSGTLPCYLCRHAGVWIVFSWLEDVLQGLPRVPPPRLNWDGVAGHLVFGELAGRETALEGVTQILPGEVVELATRSEHHERLWSAVDFARRGSNTDLDTSTNRLRDTVRGCARSWASCHEQILLRLSGGVDSSILLSCLAHGSTTADVTCLNLHSPGSDSDERRYARLAAARAGRELVERERDPALRLEAFLNVARTPTPGNYVGRMSASVDAQLAAERKATALFTGSGGDQLLFEIPRWWPAADYLRCRGLDRGFVSAAMDAARLGKVSVWTTIASAFAERLHPTVPWLEVHKDLPLLGPAAAGMAVDMTVLARRFIHPDLQRATDLPLAKATQTYYLLYPTPYYDPFHVEGALETVNPLLSQPLLELCLQLPTWVLTHGGRGRGLARRAFATDLPKEIATRRSKGGIEEHIKTVLARNIDFARSMLLDGELVRRGLLDRTRVEVALSGRPTTLPSNIGQLHVYVGIEAWLSRWSAHPRDAAAA